VLAIAADGRAIMPMTVQPILMTVRAANYDRSAGRAANGLSMILPKIGRRRITVLGDVADARPWHRVRERTLLLGAQIPHRERQPMADGSSPTQRADEVTCPASAVRVLLLAYQGVLGTVDDLPAVPLVLWTHADRGLPARLRYLPRPKWLLRLFVVRHLDASLALLARRYSAGAALGSLSEADLRDREAVKEFRQSLPPVRQVLCLVLLVVAVLAVARPLPVLLAKLSHRALFGPFDRWQATIDQLGQGFSTDAGSLDKAINAVVAGGPGQTATVLYLLALAAYLVLRPFVPAFRLKRMLLNLSADRRTPGPSATSRWNVSQATGIYEQERQVFTELGVRRPREVPFDLLVPALAMLVPLAIAVSGFNEAITGSTAADRWLSAVMGTLFLIIVVVRLGWLSRMWRLRRGHFGPCMPFEVAIPTDGRLSVAKVERPVGVRILVFGLFLLLVGGSEVAAAEPHQTLPDLLAATLIAALLCTAPVSYLWWRRVNRELRGVDEPPVRPRSTRRRSATRIRVIVGTLTVVPAFIAVSRRIRRAQTRAGLPQTLRFGWLLLPALLVHPLLVAYLQYELNKIWTVLGEPLDPWDGSPPAPEADLTPRWPWLRPPRSLRAPHLPGKHHQHERSVLVTGEQTSSRTVAPVGNPEDRS
jgi:hypothetical protein